ncbi:MAG: DUF1456 family protein [Alcanivoracaceae bacterium]|nr:DUF1456 family protein [Alcanivoracaceae bacterium]
MNNNDIIRRLRFILDVKDTKIIKIIALGGHKVPLPRVTSWLKREEDEGYQVCSDQDLLYFLDGLIIEKRGPKDGAASNQVQRLDNNLIFKKLRIAYNLQSEDILDIMEAAKFNISNSELTAFFRKKTHRHYRKCQNQMLRKFLKGLQLLYSRNSNVDSDSNLDANKDT